jgi:hypothetical protein
MNFQPYIARFSRSIRRSARPAWHWLLYICAASQMADLSCLPVDDKTVDRYLGRDRKLY